MSRSATLTLVCPEYQSAGAGGIRQPEISTDLWKSCSSVVYSSDARPCSVDMVMEHV